MLADLDPALELLVAALEGIPVCTGIGVRRLEFVGKPGLGALLAFEAALVLASWVPGALGLVLRSAMYPWILGSVGRNVVFIANLAPRKMRFGVSEGMILSAGFDGGALALLDADAGALPGMPVR